MIFKKNILLFIFILFLSCNQNDNKINKLLIPPSVKRFNKCNIEITDTLHIKLECNINLRCFQLYSNNDSLLYILDNINFPYSLFKIDVKNETYINEIKIKEEYRISHRINSIYPHNEDSIFCIEDFPLNIFIINKTGTIIYQINFKDQCFYDGINTDLISNGFGCLEINYFNKLSKKIFLSLIPGGDVDFFGSDLFYRQSIFNIKEKKWDLFYGKYEGVLKLKKNNVYFYDMHYPYSLILNSYNYVSYPVDHWIYVYELISGKLLYKFACPGKETGKLPKPLSPKTDDAKLNKLRRNTPFYGHVCYHKKSNLFTRYYNHGNSKNYRSIIVFNDNNEIIGETKFLFDEISNLVPTSFGYYASPSINMIDNENELFLYKLEIKKNE